MENVSRAGTFSSDQSTSVSIPLGSYTRVLQSEIFALQLTAADRKITLMSDSQAALKVGNEKAEELARMGSDSPQRDQLLCIMQTKC